VLQRTEDRRPHEAEHQLLEPPELRGTGVHHLHVPALLGAVASVHLIEITDEQRGLVAPGARPQLHDAPGPIGILVVGAEIEQLVPLPLPPRPQFGQLRLGQFLQLGVAGGHRDVLVDLPLERDELAILQREPGERAVLAGRGRKPRLVREHLGIDEGALQFLEPGELGFELVAHGSGRADSARFRRAADSDGQDGFASAAGFFFRLAYPAPANLDLNFSMRPAVSTNFSLPVKNGWHMLQMSTLISGTVLRVENVLPQPQRTTVSR
jgi:hypothetical protein